MLFSVGVVPISELALSVREAARLLGLSERTVYELIHHGRIPHKRIQTGRGSGRSGRIIVPRQGLEAWLAQPDEAPRARAFREARQRRGRR